MLYFVLGTKIIFYMMHRFSANIYFMTQINEVMIPTTVGEFSILGGQLNKLYKIAFLYQKYCFVDKELIRQPHTNILPYSVVLELLDSKTKKRKTEWGTSSSSRYCKK
jgi:hypothetical protein